ncbi:PhoX family phosphatase [Streptomyces sp. NPDC005811]|uniref:PhoX family protein n=1 Tax=Streptomyces sp. NPDC005811 TaxID=3154565 RepID=UPI0033E5EA70
MAEPRFLPLLGEHRGRSAMTCLYRCGNACAHPAPNTSGNPYFGDVVAEGVSRRGALRGAGALVLGVTAGGLAAGPAAASSGAGTAGTGTEVAGAPGTGTRAPSFPPVAPTREDTVKVPEGYEHAVVVSWGDPVTPGSRPLDPARLTAAAQARTFGYNNDYVAVLPLPGDDRGDRALLVCNHEYTNPELMFSGFTSLDALSEEEVRATVEASGMSVVEIRRDCGSGRWRLVREGARRHNRRVTRFTTRFTVTGPAAGHPLLRTAEDPRGRTVWGTLANCAGGVTPWGTVLSGEENFNYCFSNGAQAPEELKPRLARYGVDVKSPMTTRGWSRVDERLDLARHPNEVHRFGWVVELDPYDPTATPRKHTALGRIKHEGATVTIAPDGRVVAYMGDDDRFEYLYKFVSDRTYDPGLSARARAHNRTLLESGSLYAAELSASSPGEIDGSGTLPSDGSFDGRGRWIPLVKNGRSMVPGMTLEEVLIYTREAADRAGATKMDRPEDVETSPVTGKVYASLTNNTRRGAAGYAGADEANPRTVNKHGHILEITEDGGDHSTETFGWTLPIVCGDPADPTTYFMGGDKNGVSSISSPDNLTFDRSGNLWIATDSAYALDANDGLYATALSGPEAGRVRRFLSAPVGAEVCGPYITPDGRTVFAAIQHPGEVDGSSYDRPASTWPDSGVPRPSVVCAWRTDGRPAGH